MDQFTVSIDSRLQNDIAILSLRRLSFALVLAASLSITFLGFSFSPDQNHGLVIWGFAITVIVLARTISISDLNRKKKAGDIDHSFLPRINRIAFFSAISDGVIWSSANWVIFSNNLSNHYLIISLTIAAATTYGLVYLFQPRAAICAAGLAILPLVVFAHANMAVDAYQLGLFVMVFGVAISVAIHELKKLVVDYHRKSFQHELAAIKEREANFIFNQHWTNTPLAAIEWDNNFRISRWNPSAESIYGYSAEEAKGKSLELIFPEEDVKRVKSKWRKLWRSQGGKKTTETCKNRAGELIHCEWHDSALTRNGVAIGITSFVEDISKKVKTEEAIKTQANFDLLTGLPNRRQMMEKINQTLARNKKGQEFAALIFLDLDHFKDINDTKGHQVGDTVLKAFAQRLLPLVRHNDMVARFGGDEFVVLLDSLGKTQTEAVRNTHLVADKLLEAGMNLCTIDAVNYDLDVSGGITLIDSNVDDANEILKTADLAMYQVKQNGRKGICFYDESLSLEAEYRVELLRSLRSSLENNEFELFFQPIVNSQGENCFYECLLRWKRANNKVIVAGDFIDIIASSPLMSELGYWIFNNVCQTIKKLVTEKLWKDDAAFFVNVSPKQLLDEAFASRVIEMVEKAKIKPSWIVVEITEESLIQNFDIVINQLNALAGFGIRIALDDFGTGYSSLALLKDIPAHFLKLDKEFIRNLLCLKNSHKNSLIVEAIIKLCSVMSINVIAEGVETEQQYITLQTMGCDYIQGYYFDKPLAYSQLHENLDVQKYPKESNVYQLHG